MKLSEAMRLATKMLDAFPNARLGEPAQAQRTLRVYAEFMEDLDYDATARAVASLVATCKFFPTIAEIRGKVADDEVGATDPDIAWGEVMRTVSKVGRYRTPTFSDDMTTIAVAAVGWQQICDSEMPAVERAAFRNAYKSAAETARRSCNADRLLAAAEARGQLAPRADRGGASIGVGDALRLLKGGDQ